MSARRETYTVGDIDGNNLIGHCLHLGDGSQVINGQLHIKNNDDYLHSLDKLNIELKKTPIKNLVCTYLNLDVPILFLV